MVCVSGAAGGPEGREAAGNATGRGDSPEQVCWMLAWHSTWWKASPAMGWPLQKSQLQGRNGPGVWNRKLIMSMVSIRCPRDAGAGVAAASLSLKTATDACNRKSRHI